MFGPLKSLTTRSFRLTNFAQQLMSDIREIFDFAADHPVRELRKLALAETVAYIQQNMSTATGVYTKKHFLDVALKHVTVDGHYVEFGVYRGGSIRYIASRIGGKPIVGFDSFEGLPQDWVGRYIEKADFSLQGKLPKVPSNAKLQPGWFDATLPRWLEVTPGPMAFVHIDCDLYTSTKVILDLIAPRIVTGTVIAFDEYLGYPCWQQHEFKAFREYIQESNVRYAYVAFSRTQAAVRITDVPVG